MNPAEAINVLIRTPSPKRDADLVRTRTAMAALVPYMDSLTDEERTVIRAVFMDGLSLKGAGLAIPVEDYFNPWDPWTPRTPPPRSGTYARMVRVRAVGKLREVAAPSDLDDQLAAAERDLEAAQERVSLLRRGVRRLSEPKKPNADTYRRNLEIAIAWRRGETLKSIGERIGVTRERVRQIAYKALRIAKYWDAGGRQDRADRDLLAELCDLME